MFLFFSISFSRYFCFYVCAILVYIKMYFLFSFDEIVIFLVFDLIYDPI